MVKNQQTDLCERLSALIDGQSSDDELNLLLAELDSSDALANNWDNFHLIGDLMRSSDMAGYSQFDCVQSVASAIEKEPVPFVVTPEKNILQFPDKPLLQKWSRQVGSWVSAAAAIGFVSWTITVVNRTDELAVSGYSLASQTVEQKQVTAPTPADWQEMLQYHSAVAPVSQLAPVVRASVNNVVVTIDKDSKPAVDPSDNMEWVRLWDQPARSSAQHNGR